MNLFVLIKKIFKVGAHMTTRTFTENVLVPSHEQRQETPEFRSSKEQLRKDGHYVCWVCGAKDDLQVHHFGAEWSLANVCDYNNLKQFCETFDPYGYGRALKDIPIESVDDIRNMLTLCAKHHICKGHGIHEMTFPIFIIQKLAKDGQNPVPD